MPRSFSATAKTLFLNAFQRRLRPRGILRLRYILFIMPRKGRNSRAMKSQQPPGARIEEISGRSLFPSHDNTQGSIFSVLNNIVFPRAAAVADVFQYYRFTKLDIELKPIGTTYALGYANGAAFDTPPIVTGKQIGRAHV